MLLYGPLAPRSEWHGPAPTASVDSNVMNEFTTTVDLQRAVTVRARTGDRKELEYRRLRARGTLWLAMALDAGGCSTLTLEDEFMPFVLRNTTDPWRERALTVLFHFVKPRIMPAWTVLNLDARLGKNGRNDTILAEDAAKRGIPVITRDKGVAKKVAALGGASTTPEEFAATVLPLADAHQRFFERFDRYAPSWVLESGDGIVNSDVTKRQCEALRFWRIRYEYMWTESPERYFLKTAMGELDL
jgi:hypothetical protein